MHPIRRRFAVLLGTALLALARTAQAQTPPANPMDAVRADQWDQAAAIAATDPDPVAAKLVRFYRLLAPGAASPAEIEAFIAANPDWPLGWLLEERRQQAILSEPDPAAVLAACARRPITQPGVLARCADAEADAGQAVQASHDARAAWAEGLNSGSDGFLTRWSGTLRAQDQLARFYHFAWAGRIGEAAAMRPRLAVNDQPMATAFLAMARGTADGAADLAALPADQRNGPLLMLAHARALRQAGDEDGAVALWAKDGAAAEQAAAGGVQGAPAGASARFWLERSILARDLLADGRAKDAYAVAAGHGALRGEMAADADFLTGFIALRFTHDPAAALAQFQALAASSRAAITQGRAQYWIGRAEAALGQDPRPAYARAVAWPTTFYGQMAALALDPDPMALARRIAALRDPAYTPAQALDFTGHEVVRAAALLAAWGDRRRAGTFLLRMGFLAADDADRSLTARLALGLGLPDIAVFTARHAGFEGSALPRAGWPLAATIPSDAGVDPALALGLIRQESSFDAGAVSPAGARGLMQLMPGTARLVAGRPVALAALTGDPGLNVALGTRYFAGLMARFGNAAPLAIAAYNAGPNRVDDWLAKNGDPRIGPVDMIDWIELIPFGETRNYVQRVLENTVIYRARLGKSAAPLNADWAK
ncbi:MAG: lytic transglycosylase domain-containing protein [Rhodospirillales bacterium]|nr:lytic transglycosylase domain-containing protein [Rhodospirillales bacterium]